MLVSVIIVISLLIRKKKSLALNVEWIPRTKQNFETFFYMLIYLTGAATNPWIRFKPDFDLKSAAFNVSAIHYVLLKVSIAKTLLN